MKKYICLIGLAVVLVSSCKKFGDINTDPTKSSNLDPAIQLGYAQQKFSGDLGLQERLNVILTMPLVGHLGGAWANQYGQFYIKQERFASVLWEDNYVNEIKNILDAEERTRNNATAKNLNAMCRVMKVYLFARLTDVYGDIPYSEASSAYTKGKSAPKYDKQEDIYTDFFKQLDTAATKFNEGQDLVNNDAFYKGSIPKWKKFTASLRLRLALRLGKRNPTKAKEEIQKAYTAGVITSADDNCMLRHDNVQNDYTDLRGNGVSAAINQGDLIGYRMTSTLITHFQNSNDPRLYVMARNYLDKAFKPFERVDITEQVKAQVGSFGVKPTDFIWDNWQNTIYINTPDAQNVPVGNNEQFIQVANWLIAPNAPFLHLGYAETELLLADASIRFNITLGVSAEEHYKRGIVAACRQLSIYPNAPAIGDAAINKFIADNAMAPGRELEQINTQLWIVYFLNGPEAYANVRRSGFPVLPSGFKSGYSDATKMPRRFEYPISEKSLNATNAGEAITRMGGKDDWNNRVWWDMP
jgi:hypothetical protein